VVSPNIRDDYLARTIEHVTNQLIKYDITEQKGSSLNGQNQQIPLAVSCAVIDFMVAGLGYVVRGEPTREVSPPCQEDPDYIGHIDGYEFDRSMRLGDCQTCDALEHVLSAAAYLVNRSLLEHLLEQEGMDLIARSNMFGPPLRNAALKGYFEIVRLLLDKGGGPDGGSYPRTEEDYQKVERQCGKGVLEQCFPDILDCPGTTLEAAARNAHKEVAHLFYNQNFTYQDHPPAIERQ